jgi:hypothetical protein
MQSNKAKWQQDVSFFVEAVNTHMCQDNLLTDPVLLAGAGHCVVMCRTVVSTYNTLIVRMLHEFSDVSRR